MPTAIAYDYWDDTDDSDNESNNGGVDYDEQRFIDLVSREESYDGVDKWIYQSRSDRSGTYFGNLSKRNMPHDQFKLLINPTDQMLLGKGKAEMKNGLEKARRILHMNNNEPITAAAAFAACTPRHFIEQLHAYLQTTLKTGDNSTWTYEDINLFLRCEVLMRAHQTSEIKLPRFVSAETVAGYKKVRDVLTKADQPASKRKVNDGQQLPACSFDPIIKEAIEACNKHWTQMFFIQGVSWVDLDDDKLPHSSALWKQFGMKMTPTKDKKLKPVFHVMAMIGAGFICHVQPDLLGLKLGDMLENAIKQVSPSGQAAQRASLAFFIDRGYLELCKAQGVNISNLIQIMHKLGVKYLGTVKDSKSFPFKIVELNESSSTTVDNGRPCIQEYGTRTSFSARSNGKDGKTATTMRHGLGKCRVARVVTNLTECRQDAWAYETETAMKRKEHGQLPPPLSTNATVAQQVDHAWKVWSAGIIELTLLQRTADWFLARKFRFSSTTFHAAVNVKAAVYLNTKSLRDLHGRILGILRLRPRKTITLENASELEDEDVPCQRNHQVRREGEGERGTVVGDEECTVDYWMRKGSTQPLMRGFCDARGIPYSDGTSTKRTTLKEMATELANKCQLEWHERTALMMEEDIADDDVVSNKAAQVSFLQRMVPYWFMRPFASSDGGAIDQGVHNEEQVIGVMKWKVKQLSEGQYHIHGRIKEFGLIAKRDHLYCSSSPDGVFALTKKNEEGNFDFVGLCVLEMKTRGTENTTDQLIASVLDGGSWGECVSGTEEFEKAVPDPAYRSQICQHAAALGLEHVMIVFSLPGADIKKIALVHVSKEHTQDLVEYQSETSRKYMPFAYVDNAVREIPSLGKDFSKQYGYAQEHHTLELDLHMWRAHVQHMSNGTPTPCRRLIDLLFSYWNKCMGNVDVVRKVLKGCSVKRGRNSGPGSLLWFELVGYILYNSFRLYQYGELEQKIDSFTTFKQLQQARKRTSFEEFLFELADGDCFDVKTMVGNFPGLREFINHGNPDAGNASSLPLCQSVTPPSAMGTKSKKGMYQKVQPFLTVGDPLCSMRLDKSLPHRLILLPRSVLQKRCILCCENCSKNPPKCKVDTGEMHTTKGGKQKKPVRMGRKTKGYCLTCNVILCKHCYEGFHTEHEVPLSSCSPYHYLLPRQTRTRSVATPNTIATAIAELSLRQPSSRVTPPAAATGHRVAEEAEVTSPQRRRQQKRIRKANNQIGHESTMSTLHEQQNPSTSSSDVTSPPRRGRHGSGLGSASNKNTRRSTRSSTKKNNLS